jgi:VanZ family protein
MKLKNSRFLRNWWPALLMMALIFIASSIPGTTMPHFGEFDLSFKKMGHAMGYGLLAAAYLRALNPGGNPSGRRIRLSVLLALLYAISDECHQIFTPGRSASPFDVMIDMVGATVGLVVWIRYHKKAAAYL